MATPPPPLPRSCATCRHFDGEFHCTLKLRDTLIPGYIADPARVFCAKHEEQDRG